MTNTDHDNSAKPSYEPWPYSRGEYVRRALWELVQATLIRRSPRRAYAWRRWWLRRFGAKMQGTASIRATTRVTFPWLLVMESESILGDNVTVYNLGQLTVGRGTVVSQNTHLCGGTHDYTRPDMPLVRSTITLGQGVWVCADAFIGPGVEVHDRAIVGARAVVTRDVPAGKIVGGNPARVIKDREATTTPEPGPPA